MIVACTASSPRNVRASSSSESAESAPAARLTATSSLSVRCRIIRPPSVASTGPMAVRLSPQATDIGTIIENLRQRSRMISRLTAASTPAAVIASTSRFTRADALPSNSPIVTRLNVLRRSTMPGAVRKTLTAHSPPTIADRGTPPRSSRSAASTPLSSGITVAPRCATAATSGAASSSEYPFTATKTQSGAPSASASATASGCAMKFSSRVRTSSPRA